ncbi:ABC transporter ATP-binding protein [Aquamicrobium sp. LC103]|uniref:ABC transporter ATP-binding protein n=1 Tax=Aquamicrobium sp. LC103 TaxID=1120658 RepID=UPI00063E9300|nr:ABC transporter ATP-binding protein [Aquamicrobium sp. LC103]TKT74903.1 ABC transporter ATP-binding protein [Aquamicrobium sp. LC103]
MASANTKEKPAPGEIVAVLRRVLSENAREYLPLYGLAVLCLLAIAGATAFIPWVMRPLIDDVFYRGDFGLIPLICAAVAGVFVVRGLATYGQAVILAKIGNNLVARYQQRIFDHLMRLGLDFYTDTRSGRLAAQINENVLGVRDMLSMTLKSIAGDAVLLVALVGAMIALDPVLSAIALLIGPPLIFVVNKIMRRLRRVARASVEVNARLVGAMQEATQGIAIVKAFTMEEQLSAKLSQLIAEAESQANKIARVSERVTPISEILAGFAIAGVIGYAAYRASVGGEPPGSVFAFITALLLAYDPARRLARVQVGLERSLVNARMIYELLDIKPHQRDMPGAKELDVGKGEIRLDRISFGYAPGLPVLHEVSFRAAAGKTTAIVGGSGAGKSTLVVLLQRFYDVEGGAILIDGQNIAEVTKHSLRRQIAYVSQHPYLFEGSVRDNIRYGRPDATDAEIEEAARLAHADEFIRQMPEGYDTLVGENGVTLSGGQRQRLSIARAIVRNAPILLLDEATSALDNESEARVQEALDEIMKSKTTIVIAHRLSTVVDADHIVVMEEGRVAEEGTHRSLASRKDGLYARFHRLQSERGLGLVDDAAMAGEAAFDRENVK